MTTGATGAARSVILGRIRDVLGDRPATAAEEHRLIAREYRQEPTLDGIGRLELLVDRLTHYQVVVYRCEAATLPRTIGEALTARQKDQLLVPSGLPREWLPVSIAAIEDRALTYAELDASQGVVTGCSLAIAETGTIVLRHGPAEGRRALTLVPDYHLCVVHADRVVQTVPEAFRRLAADHPTLVTTISGPSATSDIEMTRIRGVHGPRTLDVVLVE